MSKLALNNTPRPLVVHNISMRFDDLGVTSNTRFNTSSTEIVLINQ